MSEVPSPELAAILADEFQRMIQVLDDEQLRRVALAKMEGCTNAEIADRLACSERSVYRRLTIIRSIWREAGRGALGDGPRLVVKPGSTGTGPAGTMKMRNFEDI